MPSIRIPGIRFFRSGSRPTESASRDAQPHATQHHVQSAQSTAAQADPVATQMLHAEPASDAEPSAQARDAAPRLNVGCGFDYREGYVNVDLNEEHKPDLVADATWLQPIADGSCAEVIAQDVLEHMPRAKGTTALYEWNRVLMPGGRLVLRIPSLTHLLQLLSSESFQDLGAQQRLIQCLYGTQGYEGDFHLNGYTEITLRHALADAGFELQALHIVDDWMFEATARKVSHVAPDELLRVASDSEFLERAYRTLFGREVDPQGKAYYLKVLHGGIARESVLEGLKASPEYVAAHPA